MDLVVMRGMWSLSSKRLNAKIITRMPGKPAAQQGVYLSVRSRPDLPR